MAYDGLTFISPRIGGPAAGRANLPHGYLFWVEVADVDHIHNGRVPASCGRVVQAIDPEWRARQFHRLLYGVGIAHDQRAAGGVNPGVGQGFNHHFRADAARVSHGDGDGWLPRVFHLSLLALAALQYGCASSATPSEPAETSPR